MTTRVRLVVTDDLDEAEGIFTDIGDDGEKLIIALGGVIRELDLTAAHAAELRASLAPYLSAGHEPGAPPRDDLEPGPRPEGQGSRREIAGTREFYAQFRKWAAENGTEIRIQPGRVSSYVYSREQREDYAAHLVKQSALGGPDGDAARARLAMARLLGFPVPEQPGTGGRLPRLSIMQ